MKSLEDVKKSLQVCTAGDCPEDETCPYYVKDDATFCIYERDKDVLAHIQQLEKLAQRPRGKWSAKKKFSDVYCCSECGYGVMVSHHFKYRKGCIARKDNRTKFCPYCGAEMDGAI